MAQRGRVFVWAGDLLARLQEAETSAETLPHRRKYLLLVSGFVRRLFDLHLEFVDEVEGELAPKPSRKARQPA